MCNDKASMVKRANERALARQAERESQAKWDDEVNEDWGDLELSDK